MTTQPPGAQPYLERVHPEDRESLLALIDLAALSDAHAIVRVAHGEGRWALVEHHVRAAGETIVLARTDVTVRERQRARDGRTDAYWRAILRNGHEAIAVLDPMSLRIRHASDHLVELFEIDPTGLEGRSLASLIEPADRQAFHACLRRLGPEADRLITEFRLMSPTGESRWTEAVVSDARRDPDVAAIVVNLRDVEDRKRSEQQLRSSERLCRALLGHLADGALVIDPDHIVRFASDRAAEILQVRVCDLVGRPVPLGVRNDGTAVLSTRSAAVGFDFDALPSEVLGRNDRWYELITHDLGADPVVDGLVLVLHDITDQRRAVEQLRYELEIDGLTGLTNRRGFEARVRSRIAAGERMHLVFLDLDGFKLVNDTYGHDMGDELLRRLAERLTRALRPSDVVARLGGDEFVVAAGVEHPVVGAEELACRLGAAVGGDYELGCHQVRLTASAGWSEAGGDTEFDDALRLADQRMYVDKRRMRGRPIRPVG